MNTARHIQRKLVTALFFCALFSVLPANADNYNVPKGQPSVTMPSPPPPQKNTDTAIDCRRPNQNARCRQPAPEIHPYPYRRPIIVNTAPPTPPVDISSLKDDWDGCRSAKLSALRSRSDGNLEQANRLDEWLWKNCRSYSDELRDLEQDQM
jgi:hypothetical protein